MTKTLAGIAASSVAAFALFTVAPSSSYAGVQQTTASCFKSADGSGGCYGNFDGFRNNSDSNAFASFNSSGSFWASLNGVNYACSANSTVMSLWPEILATRSFFSISWDKNGSCTSLNVVNTSAY